MTASDALALERPVADHRLAYASDPAEFGELRLPDGEGPFPVAVVIHGGCWLAEYELGYMSALAKALTRHGIATWSIEYRRVGDAGGGWPGTFIDVGAAADALRTLAPEYSLDLERVAAVGHSAGGHLALWLAARPRLPADDPLRGTWPLEITGAVALAGIPDLAGFSSRDGCGAAVPGLLGGQPEEHPDRLRRVSPIAMPASGVGERLIIGGRDTIVPRAQAERYAEHRRGSEVEIVEVASAGHFELVDPSHQAWPVVRDAVVFATQRRAPVAQSIPIENMCSRSCLEKARNAIRVSDATMPSILSISSVTRAAMRSSLVVRRMATRSYCPATE
jgi:acetyl esterase/lipase